MPQDAVVGTGISLGAEQFMQTTRRASGVLLEKLVQARDKRIQLRLNLALPT